MDIQYSQRLHKIALKLEVYLIAVDPLFHKSVWPDPNLTLTEMLVAYLRGAYFAVLIYVSDAMVMVMVISVDFVKVAKINPV